MHACTYTHACKHTHTLFLITQQNKTNNFLFQKLREDNAHLRTELESALSELRRLNQQKTDTEAKYKQHLSQLAVENDKLKEKLHQLNVDLKQAQDKPAEVNRFFCAVFSVLCILC